MLHSITTNPDIQAAFQKILTDVALLLGSVVGILIAQAGVAIKNSHLNMLQKMIAERLVGYAEQTITTGSTDKAAWVSAQLKAKFPNLDEATIQHLLEAAVLNVTAQTSAPAAPVKGA